MSCFSNADIHTNATSPSPRMQFFLRGQPFLHQAMPIAAAKRHAPFLAGLGFLSAWLKAPLFGSALPNVFQLHLH
jgi:hypothetical protein